MARTAKSSSETAKSAKTKKSSPSKAESGKSAKSSDNKKSAAAGKKQKKAKSQKPKSNDAIAVLKKDHDEVKQIFAQYRKLVENDSGDFRKKEMMVSKACEMLSIHAIIEEEILYPVLRETIDDLELVDEAEVEHDCAKELIAQLESMHPGEHLYDAKFIVLGEQVKHHIEEEENKIFPKLRKLGLNLERMGTDLMDFKTELQRRGSREREPQHYYPGRPSEMRT